MPPDVVRQAWAPRITFDMLTFSSLLISRWVTPFDRSLKICNRSATEARSLGVKMSSKKSFASRGVRTLANAAYASLR